MYNLYSILVIQNICNWTLIIFVLNEKKIAKNSKY